MLRTRPSLKQYFDARDLRGNSDVSNDASDDDIEGNGDGSQ